MRACSKCKREKLWLDKRIAVWAVNDFIQVFGKWVCSDCFLKSGGGNREAILKAKARLRKRIPPKTRERSYLKWLEELGKIELRKRWVREDLNRVYECYRVLKPLTLGDLFVLDIARKPKKRQMIWREIVFKKELEK